MCLGTVFGPAVLMRRSADILTSHHSHICTTRLKFFGHITHADPSVDHSRALRACVAPLPRDWDRQSGGPHHTWLRQLNLMYTQLATTYDQAWSMQRPAPDKTHDDHDGLGTLVTLHVDPSVDHSQALRACVVPLPRDWVL